MKSKVEEELLDETETEIKKLVNNELNESFKDLKLNINRTINNKIVNENITHINLNNKKKKINKLVFKDKKEKLPKLFYNTITKINQSNITLVGMTYTDKVIKKTLNNSKWNSFAKLNIPMKLGTFIVKIRIVTTD